MAQLLLRKWGSGTDARKTTLQLRLGIPARA
jgi:hypothetical protein